VFSINDNVSNAIGDVMSEKAEKKNLTVRFDENLLKQLKELANSEKRSVAGQLEYIVEKYLSVDPTKKGENQFFDLSYEFQFARAENKSVERAYKTHVAVIQPALTFELFMQKYLQLKSIQHYLEKDSNSPAFDDLKQQEKKLLRALGDQIPDNLTFKASV